MSSSAGGGGQHDAHQHHGNDGTGDGTASSAVAAAAMAAAHHRPRQRRTAVFVTELQPNDVLMGRGAPICDNTGNIRFLQLVRERCGDYKRAVTRKEKDAIARNIVATIHARQGLFLRRVDSPEEEVQLGILPTGGTTMAWTAADEKTVLLKIKQALRDRGLEANKDTHPQQQQQQGQQQQSSTAAAATAQVPSSSNMMLESEHPHAAADDASAVDPFGMAGGHHGLFSPESSSSPSSSSLLLSTNKRARSEISQQQHQQFLYSPRYGPAPAAAAAAAASSSQQQEQMDMMLLNVQQQQQHQQAVAAHRQRSMSDSAMGGTATAAMMMNRFDPTNNNMMMMMQQQQQLQQFPPTIFSQQQQGGQFHPGTVLSQPQTTLQQQQLQQPLLLQGQEQDSVGTMPSTTANSTTMRRASFAGHNVGGDLLSPSGDASFQQHLFEGGNSPTFHQRGGTGAMPQPPLFAPQQQQQLQLPPQYQLQHGQRHQQDWNTNASAAASAAGFNLFPDTTTNTANFQQQQQQLEGQSLKQDFRTTTTAGATGAFPLDADSELDYNKQQQQQGQQRGRELKGISSIDKKLPAIDKNTATSTSANTNETAGEAALRKACQVFDMKQGQATTTTTTTASSNDGDGSTIHLDHIELCLLSVLNSRGLPTWSSTGFQNNNNGDNIILSSTLSSSSTSGGNINKPCRLTWNDIGNLLVQQVQTFLSRKTTAFFANNAATATQQQRLAIEGFVTSLVTLAMAYSTNPTNLARMTIMLLEKLRLQHQQQGLGGGGGGGGADDGQLAAAASNTATAAASLSTTAASAMTFPGLESSFVRRLSASVISDSERSRTADQADSSHGTTQQQQLQNDLSFSTFLIKELGQWAVSLNVADEVGFPVPCSSKDFVANFPQFGQHDVFSTAAILDASGCRAVLSQVSLLTRLRVIFQSNSSDQMISILRTSPAPQWGTSFEETALIDMSLLQALLGNGFSGLMDIMATSDDLLGILLRHTSITKIDVEKRADQLTRLLHQHIHSRTLNRITHEQGARIVEMIGL